MYLHACRSHHVNGFTLVELSIVIVIISLLTASGLVVSTTMIERAAYVDTNKVLTQLDESLRDYYIVNGRLPCPASVSTLPGSAGFGVETACTSGAAVAGTVHYNAANGGVRKGMIPVRTLGLSDNAASDKYGSRIIYTVSESLTDSATFGAALGAITIKDGASVAGNVIINEAAYALHSHGRDRNGGLAYTNASSVSSCPAAATLDKMNCEFDDADLRDAPFNKGDVTARYYDDLIRWAPKFHLMAQQTQSTSLWAANGDDIYSVGVDEDVLTTNVGIGLASPEQRLHVSGISLFDTPNDSYMYLRKPNGSGGFWNWGMQDNASSGVLAFNALNNDWSYDSTVLSMNHTTGYVGIGTNAPERTLHVMGQARFESPDDFFVSFRKPNGVGGYWNWTLQDSGSTGLLMFRSRDALWNYKATLISMDHTTGHVGIGTMSPTNRLHVSGGPIYVGNMWLGESGDTTVAPDIQMSESGLIVANDSLNFIIDGENDGSTQNFHFYKGAENITAANKIATLSSNSNLFLGLQGTESSINGSSAIDQRLILRAAQSYDDGATLYLNGRGYTTLHPGAALYYAARNTNNNDYAHAWYNRKGGATDGLMRIETDGDGWMKGALTQNSDMRLKQDIKPVANALEKLQAIRGVSYRWNENAKRDDLETRHLGVVAQEVQAVFPELVGDNEEGYLTVNAIGLVAPLIEAVKELKAENIALRAENERTLEMLTTLKENPQGAYNPLTDFRLLSALLATVLLSAGLAFAIRRH